LTLRLGFEEVVFLNAVALVEVEFVVQLGLSVSRREDLEDDVGGDVVFEPHFVGAARSFGTTEDDHDVGRGAFTVVVGVGVPEEVGGDEDVGMVLEEEFEVFFDNDDPLVMEGIEGHRETVFVGEGVDVVRLAVLELGVGVRIMVWECGGGGVGGSHS